MSARVMGTSAEAIVIGASAGALEALSVILPSLPAGYGLPVLVVVHLPPDKTSILAELLQAKCNIKVREAEDKEPVSGGTAYCRFFETREPASARSFLTT